MNGFDIRAYLLPIYLLIVFFVQINLTIINAILVLFPLLVIILSIYLKNKKIGIIGMFLFYMVSLSTIDVSNIEQYLLIFSHIIFIIFPSLILLGEIIGIENEKTINFKPTIKPFILSILLFIIIIVVFYIICIFLWDGFLINQENVEAQIITLSAISIVVCLPFLITQKIKKLI